MYRISYLGYVSAAQGVDERMINVHYYSSGDARSVGVYPKLQALVYDILPSTTAVFGLRHRVQKTVS